MKNWNRCDVCGKFISFKDFTNGAIHKMILPDSEVSIETWETLCLNTARRCTMGLDMYLTGTKYLWDFEGEEGRKAKIDELFPSTVGRVKGVIFEIGYWRKDNAIHNWFVQNVQEGVDECQESDVSSASLIELKKACQQAIKGDYAEMPTTSGFSFGTTDYDEWYTQSLEQTIQIVDDALQFEKEGGYITYQSSW